MSVSQLQVPARLGWWRRLSPASFGLAGLTALIVWAAVAVLLRQGQLQAVLSAGRAELAAPLLIALVVGTGICERFWPADAARSWPAATSRTRASWPCTPSW